MDWQARWIWSRGEENPWNYWLSARKSFTLKSTPKRALIHVTADTRYVLWVNGERIGRGPVRAWPAHWRYDTYDLSGRLKQGENVIAILVLHYGIGTFQSLPTRGGLLAQVEADGEVAAATDDTWKVREHPAYSRVSPRITCQQAWAEVYDAREDDGGADWIGADCDDSAWESAVTVGAVGCDPWKELLPRDIPFLTEEPIYPVNVLEARTVRAPQTVWAFDLRRNLLPGVVDANPHALCGLVAASVVAERAADVTLSCPRPGNYAPGMLRVNGRDVEREEGTRLPFEHGSTFRFRLEPGENLLVWDVTCSIHSWSAAWVVEADEAITEQASILGKGPWVTFGPFETTDDPAFQQVWNAESRDGLAPAAQACKALDQQHCQPFFETAYAEPAGQLDSRAFAALAAASEEAALFEGGPEDTEVLLDFGRMTVGYWEMDIADAAEGAVIDLVGFESIQEGHRDHAWGINNTVRYTTRAGRQTFHSVIRRGCRYLLVTVRKGGGPVRIRSVRTLQNTYPLVERGSFQCNDYLLNRAWEIGQYTTRLCSEDTYVDCPTYEQTFWVGDARNEGAVNHYAFGDYALTRRCLLLAAESLERSPLVESQVPSAWEDMLPTWSLLWVLACEEYWRITGDREFLEQVYPAIKQQNEYCLTQIGEDGLLRLAGWNLLDWAPLDTPADGACTHMMAWFVMCLERQAALAAVLGRAGESEPLLAARDRLVTAMNEHLWNEERGAYIDCIHADGARSETISQQTNTVVLLAGCAPPERLALIEPLVADAPEGVVPVGSPFFMFFTCEALAKLGDFEKIADLTRRWWGMMLDTGATTCWETFPGFEPAGRYTRSHCHAWSAGPTFFQSRYQLGVSPMEPGFGKALVSPVPAGLTWARGRVPTPHGEIGVDWRLDEDAFELRVTLPPGVEAEIRLPEETRGFAALEAEGAVRAEGDPAVFHPADTAVITIRASK